ncbi:dTDP-4-dehydrorhamnose reductase [Thermoleophilum album]|uniref:dTDP-4-dehydrorhamnose reductase n=1 Tax=Thermoleophilum album TaxID=29539 RepID=UPI00237CB781|nr:dTDP-4-dehydrorhamnose reductase [Thermoleophilum album]WDT93563.1 dTDP-4-dehydrorhamnose reductase [Thermoleophilum album]
MSRVLVTGAGGMLGRVVLEEIPGAVGATRQELDICDERQARAVLARERPHWVVHCAAYTNVDGAEAEPEEALRVNGEGAGIVARAAAEVGAGIVYISSDYVFDGSKGSPYVEDDATGPISAYGRSKLAGEQAVTEANDNHLIVRTSWLFGPYGRNFVDTILTLAREREKLQVVHDQIGCPTYTRHLARAIAQLLEAPARGVHHVAGGGACSWFEFASEAVRLAGVACNVEPCTTEQFPRPAPRPANSVLRATREQTPRLDHWRVGLRAYLAERGWLVTSPDPDTVPPEVATG